MYKRGGRTLGSAGSGVTWIVGMVSRCLHASRVSKLYTGHMYSFFFFFLHVSYTSIKLVLRKREFLGRLGGSVG